MRDRKMQSEKVNKLNISSDDSSMHKLEAIVDSLDFLKSEARRAGDRDVALLMESARNLMHLIYVTKIRILSTEKQKFKKTKIN